MSYSADELAEKIKALINERGLSRAEIVSATGISATKLSNITTGDANNFGVETLIALSKYFGVSADWLLGISDDRSLDRDVKITAKTLHLSTDAIETLAKDAEDYHSTIEKLLRLAPDDRHCFLYNAMQCFASRTLAKTDITSNPQFDPVESIQDLVTHGYVVMDFLSAAEYYAGKAAESLKDGLVRSFSAKEA